jgi:HPt (histidine-containing phosphotransfer) domain-containing protein
LFDNDRDSLSEIAKLFENTCEESMSFLEVAFKQPDQQILFNTAHRLKGAVANMKAPQVLQLCQQLETAIQDADIVGAEKLSQDVTRQISRLRAAVREQFLS